MKQMLTKEQMVARYMKKSVEWLAKELASQRMQAYNDGFEMNKLRAKISGLNYVADRNSNLAEILQNAGVHPRKLIVEYATRDCDNCKHCNYIDYDGDAECMAENNYGGEECEYKPVIESIAFYTYKIDNDSLTGIVADFSREEFDVLSVTDEATGRVLYEYKDED